MGRRMTMVDVEQFFTNPFIQWKLRRKVLKDMKLRSRDEILNKKFEWEQKLLIAEKTEQPADYNKFKNYLDVLDWILNNEHK